MKKWIVVGAALILAGLSVAFAGHREYGFGRGHEFRGAAGAHTGGSITAGT